jgi:hypothetical protein
MFSKSSVHAHAGSSQHREIERERERERERARKKERKKEFKNMSCERGGAIPFVLHFRTPNLNVLRTVNSMSAIPHSFFKATIISGSVAQKNKVKEGG